MSRKREILEIILGIIVLIIPILAFLFIRRIDLFTYSLGLFPMNVAYILNRLIIGLFIFCGLILITSGIRKKGKRSFLFIASIVIPFLIAPLPFFSSHWYQKRISFDKNSFDAFIDDNPSIAKGKYVLCFLSTGCEYCEMTTKKIATIQQRVGHPEAFKYIFYDDSNVDKFIESTHSNRFDLMIVPTELFLTITHGRTPIIFLINDGEIIQKYSYTIIDEKGIKRFLSE
ncbi:MAG: hypothetical protein J6T30_04425 [Bacteroidales bacterium]|nr:hypothetical protein [Bacteroidales bacterium]